MKKVAETSAEEIQDVMNAYSKNTACGIGLNND